MSLQETIDKLNEFDFAEIDFNDIDWNGVGLWPSGVKAVLWVVALIVVIVGGYHLNLKDLHGDLGRQEKQEKELRVDFEKKVNEAANLESYRVQMAEMKESFEALLKQLPQDTEVPGLLDDISNKGLDSGLTFDTIDLKAEKTEEFYIELPIDVNVRGGYHDFGAFVSGVAGLPRIVTLHDFSIKNESSSDKEGRNRSELSMVITAKTYRYRPQEDDNE